MSLLGGWKVHDEVLEEHLEVFKQATEGLVGTTHEPKMVATQVVSGIKYCFICKTIIITPDKPEGITKITILKDSTGKVAILRMEPIL